MKKNSKKVFRIGGERILPGERKRIHLKAGSLYDYTDLTMPLEVIRGVKEGPTLFISAAIHGDEINGVEIVKRLLQKSVLKRISGTLIVVPVVNVFGFNHRSRYLPDRRDLNRSFPGSSNGSLASRLANIFMKEIVSKCSHGIDLHTGALHRTNLPQIRAFLEDQETKDLAMGFGTPVVVHSELRDGSLREAARKKKVKILLFEGGEALRFEEDVIRVGVRGCLAVMRKIGMLPPRKLSEAKPAPKVYVTRNSQWTRAPHGGSFTEVKKLGDQVEEGELVAIVSDTFGGQPFEVRSPIDGIIIGKSTIPLVNRGEAMFHIASFKNTKRVKRAIDDLELMS